MHEARHCLPKSLGCNPAACVQPGPNLVLHSPGRCPWLFLCQEFISQSPCVQETSCPQSVFREELNSQHGRAPGSLLIYFDNCNFILIIYGPASESVAVTQGICSMWYRGCSNEKLQRSCFQYSADSENGKTRVLCPRLPHLWGFLHQLGRLVLFACPGDTR